MVSATPQSYLPATARIPAPLLICSPVDYDAGANAKRRGNGLFGYEHAIARGDI